MTRSPLQCCTSIIRSSALVQVSSSLSIGRTCAWPRRLPATEMHFRHFSREFFNIKQGISPHIFLHFFALCTSESLLRLPISNMTILPAKQAACDLCGLHGSAMPRLPLENWSAIVLSKTWRCGGDAHVQIYTSICVYLCLLLYYYI